MKETIYLGTYTKGDSKGIYKITLDTENKTLEDLTLVAEAGHPTYLTLSDDRSYLYGILREDGGNGIGMFKTADEGTFERVATATDDTASPCYVSYDAERSLVYAAHYGNGTLSVYSTSKDGSISLADRVQHEGSGVHENQDGPHAHFIDLTPDKKYAVACDLGTDEVYTYSISDQGTLTEVGRYHTKPGTGPRHLVFSKDGTKAYVLGELSSEVVVLNYDSSNGSFDHIQTISSIPEDREEFKWGAAIRMSNDGKFLYVSNRGHDSIAVFKVSPTDGTLEVVEYVSTEGKTPRDFDLDPTNQFVVVGHQDSDNLTLFERDSDSGKLTLLEKDVYAPEVVGVTFA
ncbi:lactonase family protein [Desemzia sp. C1]|uniref:lactonase family protein n=1 Tax=Desemzia TaxID=82800 RepID=UPI001660AB13|nr:MULTISPECIES: lactonase family protein [Desemzia]MCI3027869.1 lactonase family protein [Desemzia sp. C1]